MTTEVTPDAPRARRVSDRGATPKTIVWPVYFSYVDETGIDGVSPLMVMVGIVVDDERLNRMRGAFAAIFENLGELVTGTLKELKSSDMLAGSGA